MKIRTFLTCGSILVFSLLAFPLISLAQETDSRPSSCGGVTQTDFPIVNYLYPTCGLDKLSWVEVKFWSDESKETIELEKPELESLLRSTSRRLLPELEHEILNPHDNYEMLRTKQESAPAYLSRRAHLSCTVGAMTNSGVYSIVTQCDIHTYDGLMNSRNSILRSGALSMGPQRDLNDDIKDNLRHVLQSLSDRFYEQISKAEQMQSSMQKTNGN